jgi:hypothetical protein
VIDRRKDDKKKDCGQLHVIGHFGRPFIGETVIGLHFFSTVGLAR